MSSPDLELRTGASGGPLGVATEQLADWCPNDAAAQQLKLSSALVVVVLIVCGAISLGMEPPLWLQPTLVGVLWGAALLTGYALAASEEVNACGKLLLVGLAVWLNVCCLQLTDLAAAESLLLMTLLFGSGWLKRRLSVGWSMQWSISDLVIVTALTACVVHAVSQLNPSPFLFGVSWAFVVGLLYSWIAFRWVWLDRWSYGSLATGIVGIVLAVSYIDRCAPVDFSWWDSLEWLCTGPMTVVAGQAMTVLVYFALVRFERDSWRTQQ